MRKILQGALVAAAVGLSLPAFAQRQDSTQSHAGYQQQGRDQAGDQRQRGQENSSQQDYRRTGDVSGDRQRAYSGYGGRWGRHHQVCTWRHHHRVCYRR